MRKHFENGQDEQNVFLRVRVWGADDLSVLLHLPGTAQPLGSLSSELHQERHCQFLIVCCV